MNTTFSRILIFATVMALNFAGHAQSVDTLKMTGRELGSQIFSQTPLPSDYNFNFNYSFKEIKLRTADSINLCALLFPSPKAKDVILYLHGSNGAADVWGKIAPVYTSIGYDFFLLDYRGYGKSEGKVVDEQQVCMDAQLAYDTLKARYGEERIIVIGQSIGTGAAAFLAANNHPKKLILQAPYYSIEDWIHELAPNLQIVDNPFTFETYKKIEQISCPIVLIHGDADDAVYYGSSQKLSKLLKDGDEFITLKSEGHNDFTKNQQYLKALKDLLGWIL
ncbi:alpha/beta hydrolase [Olivibacter domesticus]|uniref:Serine aminopeptidase S33 domain-containing protein n=1 Tax=Olivibacter domesticus TaxID=407022 RepID=A0A1H7GLQ7_OLID1|nr:alpha/beta fold hydrolase [Olivibacter domesticus]SEK39004.1 hypothetical protein SAMN05661044_00125 [Olivibacter domesticus]